jgi:hypothetical protein
MQHFRRLAATAVITGLLGMPLLAPGTAGAQEAGNSFVQRGVTVETTAENAVVARTKALTAAQRQAYDKMASELGFTRSASDSQIESMVDSIIVEQERATRSGYNGRLTVNFNQRRVSSFAGISSGGGSATAGAEGGGATASSYVAPPVVPTNQAFNPAATFVETVARFNGMAQWLDLRRRLLGSPEVSSVDIVAIAVDGARLRLGLRMAPPEAAPGLAERGILLQQAGGVPPAGQAYPGQAYPGQAYPGQPGVLAPPVRMGASPVPVAQPNAPWQLGLAGGA